MIHHKNTFTLYLWAIVIGAYSFAHAANAPIVIGVGQQCTIAIALREYGIRRAAYPFDWIICYHDAIVRCLEDNFEHFFQPSSIQLRYDGKAIIDYYGHEFGHDFPTISHPIETHGEEAYVPANTIRKDWQDYLPRVYEKYQRRIARFRKVLSGTEHIYLIRHELALTPEKALQIQRIIQTQYPQLPFTLIAVGETGAAAYDWNLPGIKNFYLEKHNPHNPEQPQWEKFFASLGIKPNTAHESETAFQE